MTQTSIAPWTTQDNSTDESDESDVDSTVNKPLTTTKSISAVKMSKAKQSTVVNRSWILRVTDGYFCNFIRTYLANAHHLSTTTIKSILETFGAAIENTIRNRLSSGTEYAVMTDESTYLNNEEMLSVCVRISDEKGHMSQFLGYWHVSSTKAIDIINEMILRLKAFGLKPEQLVSASFDGAANMSGDKGGVQALLQSNW